jgi:hypothetical protein
MNAKATAPTDNFSEATEAHAKVKATITALRAEYDATEAEIDSTTAELDRQLNLRLPPDEMKHAVIEILSANAKRFEQDMRAAVCQFVMHKTGGVHVPTALVGKPMPYADIESIIAGELGGDYRYTNLLKAGGTQFVFDAPLFMFFESIIAERLASILAGISPDEMGYGSLSKNDVGCGLEERRTLIAKLQADLAALHTRRTELAGKLSALGYMVPYKPTRQG